MEKQDGCLSAAVKELGRRESSCDEISVDSPHPGFFFIFPYADLKSLLTLERVSKLIQTGVNDVLTWTKLLVEPPLSSRLSNDILLSLVRKSKGGLKCLSLIECSWITDEALEKVLVENPSLEKLHVPRCISLSADGITNMLKQHAGNARSEGLPGIRQVRVRGIYGLTQEHMDKLQAIVSSGRQQPKPLLLTADRDDNDDERSIDVAICPRCRSKTPLMVYDCTRDGCDGACRGCVMCIPRCIECGVCFIKDEWEGTCCVDSVCQTCWLRLPKCAECNGAFCRYHSSMHFRRDSNGSRICISCLSDDFELRR